MAAPAAMSRGIQENMYDDSAAKNDDSRQGEDNVNKRNFEFARERSNDDDMDSHGGQMSDDGEVHHHPSYYSGHQSPQHGYGREDERNSSPLDEDGKMYLQEGNSSYSTMTESDFDSMGKSKKRRKQSKPIRLPAQQQNNIGLPLGHGGALDMTRHQSFHQRRLKMEEEEEEEEEGVRRGVSFSPEASNSPDLPLNLCSGGPEPSASSGIRVASLAKLGHSPSPVDDKMANQSAVASALEWQSSLQDSLPFFAAKNPNWPQEMAALGEIKAQADLLNQQFQGHSGNFLPNFLQPSPFLPFLLPPSSTAGPNSKNSGGIVTNGAKLGHEPTATSSGPLSLMSKPVMVGAGGPGGTPIRIFNPEAYCHLCNKEFCNKYFLKTHKANKHGIYSGDGPPPPKSSSGGSSNPESPAASVKNPFMPMTTFLGTPVGPPPVPAGVPLPPFRPVGTTSKKAGVTPADPNKPINPEAFCELCKKEFCNKYFLKRHKLKIHGIVPVDSPGDSKSDQPRSKDDNGSNSKSKSPTGDKEVGRSKAVAKGPFVPPVPLPSQQQLGMPGSPMVALPCKLCKFVCESKAQLEQHLQTSHDLALPPPTADSWRSVETSTREDEPGHVRTLPKEIFQLVSKDSLMEKLKDQGVVNPELICNLCGKEFADARYLMLHQQTKHSSLQALERNREEFALEREMAAAERQFWKPNEKNAVHLMKTTEELQIQKVEMDSPMADMPRHHGQRADARFASPSPKDFHSQDPEGSKKPSSNNENGEVICTECDSSFLNAHWLGVHQQYVHPKKETPLESVNNEATSAPKRPEMTTEGLQAALAPSRDNTKAASPLAGKTTTTSTNDPGAGDLEKLQSMLIGLNNTKAIGHQVGVCEICARQFDNPALLKMHMIEEHGVLQSLAKDKVATPVRMPSMPGADLSPFIIHQGGNSPFMPTESQPSDNFFLCPICKQGFSQRELLMRHLHTAHSLPQQSKPAAPSTPPKSAKSATSGANKTTSDPNAPKPEKKTTWSTSRSYCQICNKELCNKYFMKTHMMKMHGINVDINGTINGGAMCDICNKVLCSKYFLKVHKQNTHGILDLSIPGGLWNANLGLDGRLGKDFTGPEGNLLLKMSEELQRACGPVLESTPPKKKVKVSSNKSLPSLKQPGAPSVAECLYCPSAYLDKVALQLHLAKAHQREMEGGEGPMWTPEKAGVDGKPAPRVYHCSLCQFSTNSLPTLLAHQNCHSDSNDADPPAGMRVQSVGPAADRFQGPAQDNSPPPPNDHQTAGPTTPGAMQCPVCFVWLPSFQVFHQHIISHRFNPFVAPFLSQFDPTGSIQAFDSMNLGQDSSSAEAMFKPDLKAADEQVGRLAQDQQTSDEEEGQVFRGRGVEEEEEEDPTTAAAQLEQQQELLRRIFGAGSDQLEISRFLDAMQGKSSAGAKAGISRTQRRKFRCSVCKKRFSKRTVCLSHIHSFHNPRNKSVTYVWSESAWRKRRIFRCSQCFFSSRFHFKVKAHFRDAHRPRARTAAAAAAATTNATAAALELAHQRSQQLALARHHQQQRYNMAAAEAAAAAAGRQHPRAAYGRDDDGGGGEEEMDGEDEGDDDDDEETAYRRQQRMLQPLVLLGEDEREDAAAAAAAAVADHRHRREQLRQNGMTNADDEEMASFSKSSQNFAPPMSIPLTMASST